MVLDDEGWVEVVGVSLLVVIRWFGSWFSVFGWRWPFGVVAGEVDWWWFVLVAVRGGFSWVEREGAGVVELGVGVLVEKPFDY